jgi:TRAP-type C4-dicarboxylate transport system substrate-binding protein
VVEGGPETIGVAVDQKSVEIGKFWTRTEEYNQINNIMVNKKKYDSLTSEQKNILLKATENAGKAYAAFTQREYSENKKRAIEEYGVKIIEPPLGPWRERGAATIARLIKEVTCMIYQQDQGLKKEPLTGVYHSSLSRTFIPLERIKRFYEKFPSS